MISIGCRRYQMISESRTMPKFSYDDADTVVVIGSGAGGGTIANELCQRGKKVVLLEAGPHLTPEDFVNDDWAAYEMLSWLDKRTATGNWRIAKDYPTAPSWHCKVVGGTTTHWSGCTYRFGADEMRPCTLYGDIPGASLIDWPFMLEELTPYYELAERKMSVTRSNNLPALPPNNNFKVMYWGARRLGLEKISTGTHAINVEIPRALATGKLDLRPGSRAVKIEHDEAGNADAVVYVDNTGTTRRQAAAIVVIAGNCVESSRLLLNSSSGQYPNGLANGFGHVGRHYLRHIVQTVWSVFDQPVNMYRGELMGGLVADFAGHDPARGFAGGYYVELNAMGLPTTAAFMDPGWWGRDFASVIESYQNMAGLFMTGEDMPQPGNRITLSAKETDEFGVPVANIHYDEHPNDLLMRNHGYKTLSAIHRAAGARRVIEAPAYPASHNLGSNRMSAQPEDGVLDRNGQAHEVRNLFVADGSAFSSGGACNPTLTIVALAIRQADFIANRASL
jgi:choline dehydrogenase-like flavoprotein